MPVLILPLILIFGYSGVRARTRLVLAGLFILASLILFNTNPVQENLFRRGHGTIWDIASFDPGELHTSGRLTAWPLYIQGIEDVWFGQGSTASVEFGNATFGTGKWSHPHNEYIRIVFDYGIVGTVLFAIPVLLLLYTCHKRAFSGLPDTLWLYRVSAGGIVVMLLLGITGNVLMYVAWFGNMLFATIGVAYGRSSIRNSTMQ